MELLNRAVPEEESVENFQNKVADYLEDRIIHSGPPA